MSWEFNIHETGDVLLLSPFRDEENELGASQHLRLHSESTEVGAEAPTGLPVSVPKPCCFSLPIRKEAVGCAPLISASAVLPLP